jgi:endogenous inhibitor of DNA gyrase (YacG/DUF329 family)
MRHAFRTGLNKSRGGWNKGKKCPKPAGFVSMKIAITCPRCGVEFLDLASNHRRYCSRKCSDGVRRKESAYRTTNCAYCGQSFRYLFAQIGERKYCSRKCAGKVNITNIPKGTKMTIKEISKKLLALGYKRIGNKWCRHLNPDDEYSFEISVERISKDGHRALIWYCGNQSIGPFKQIDLKEVLDNHEQIITAFRKAPISYLLT